MARTPVNAAPTPPTAKKSGWLLPVVLGSIVGGLVVVLVGMNLDWTRAEALPDVDDAEPAMVDIPGGTFVMGNDKGAPDERPAHEVTVRGFKMDKTEVTNGQFAKFVKATKYQTVAERKPDPAKYPGADPKLLVPGSAVYNPGDYGDPWKYQGLPPWWKYGPGANWRHPDGPGSNLDGKKDYPAVHIAWEDAAAYAKWAGKRLPTEAEWEYAARGGLKGEEYGWGNFKQGTDGKWYANTFQGTFPKEDAGLDGYKGVAPVAKFPANGYGLHDLSGNVWEWCQDWYDSGYYATSPKDNPPGPATGEKDPDGGEPQRVRRGGSYLCDDSYCKRYVPNARDKNPPDSGASHTGFRCVKDK